MIPLRLELSGLPPHHQLHRLLESRTPQPDTLAEVTDRVPFWPASLFQLDQSRLFQESTRDEQMAILTGCNRAILEEAFWIEKCGMYFAPKMALLAQTLETQMLYCQFAAEEASHFRLISQFLNLASISPPIDNPFITFLAQTLETESQSVLQFFIQVVLEGWGIAHYRTLSKSCLNSDLKAVFERILKDEAHHHGSGVILCSEQPFGTAELSRVEEIVTVLLQMIKIGPAMVVNQVEQVKGHLSPAQKKQLFGDLKAEETTDQKLRFIQNLMRLVPSTRHLLETLEAKGCFIPICSQ